MCHTTDCPLVHHLRSEAASAQSKANFNASQRWPPINASSFEPSTMALSLVVPELICLRDELIAEAQRYAQKDKPSQAHLDRLNDRIDRLCDGIEPLEQINLEMGGRCADEWQALLRQDPSIDSAFIYIQRGQNPCRSGRIFIDLSNPL
jgi:hypothetical protein